ncbi:MAG: threonylcarbamoyl-AMP synthase [Dehalococcoidales bacterium]|nr:threonylcarbamoyl-AMP synthase [Dehalococcoidales bacterium]
MTVFSAEAGLEKAGKKQSAEDELKKRGLTMSDDLPAGVRQQIERGVDIIREGGVVAFPTDTVYGLGAGAYFESGIENIFKIKKRPLEMALPLLLADVSQIHEVAKDLPSYAWRLIKHFFPGGLTLIVFRTRIVRDIITAGGDTVAIRVPDHPVPRALIKGSGMPVVGTSANISGQPAALTAGDVNRQFGDALPLVIEAVPPPAGTESTVVDVTGEVAVILREGAISRAEIERVAGAGGGNTCSIREQLRQNGAD